ncbi:hypothetical protein HJG60_010869 [Phyllostomus discolor]|uniref:L1 transposable element RRM domain-containing protein n=1 Tax=Phyllostomus discolor TaxID=89673 RepID=A0A834EA84_9CHIR|nr:hypothetical protein HJG60_010869 [Phyllostomus discolor]
MMENFLNLMTEKVTQIQEIQGVPNKRNPKRPTSRNIIIKIAKFQDKDRILKAAREKQEETYKEVTIKLAADLSMDTLQARKEWQEIFQGMRTRGPAIKATLSSKALNQDRRPNKKLSRLKKSKRTHLHQTSSARDLKGTTLRNGRKRERERERRT